MKRLLVLLLAATAVAQVPDSRGKDFWFCFLPNFHSRSIDDPDSYRSDSLFIYVAAEQPTTVTLQYMPYNGRPPQTITARITDPRVMLTIALGYYGIELIGVNGGSGTVDPARRHTQRPVPYSLHLTSDQDVTVYAMNHAEKTSDAFLVLPTDALGRDYYIMSYNADDGYGIGANSFTPSQFAVVAVEDSTVVEFARVTAPLTDGSVSRVLLQQGEVYLVQSLASSPNYDLTGTRIKSNRPIAVFSGHQRSRLPRSQYTRLSSRDCLIEQMPPTNTWGRNALLVPYPDPPDDPGVVKDVYRILAARDSTVVYLDSTYLTTLNAGQFYEGVLDGAHLVQANRPILVAQFRHTSMLSQDIGRERVGDPFMMLVPPAEQFLRSYRFICSRVDSIVPWQVMQPQVYKYHYVTVVAPDTALATVVLDGQPLPQNLFRRIPKSNYFYAWCRLDTGVHTITASAPIGIYVYGYGYADSYGYTGGMSFRRYDFDPPTVSSLPPCPPYRIVVYDTLPTDSRVDVVRIVEDSTVNVAWQIVRSSLLPVDSVEVRLSLLDPYEDGVVTIVAEDAERFVTRKRVELPGMTLRAVADDGSVVRFPIRYAYRSATQRTSCFAVSVTNVGKFPQAVVRARSRFGVIDAQSSARVLARGDTLQLRVCYRAQRTTSITDTLWLETPCGRYAAAVFSIEFIVDSLPPQLQRQEQPCPPEHSITALEQGYTQTGIARVAVLDSFNVIIRLLGAAESGLPTAEELHIRIAQRDWRLDGWYRIAIADSVGNTAIVADTFEGHTVMIANRDSLQPRQQFSGRSGAFSCDTIELYNYGLFPKRFDRLMVRGVEVAVPPSMVPLVIPPGKRVRLPLCTVVPFYSSFRDNLYRDTLELTIGCYARRLPIEIALQPSAYAAQSSCNVTITAGSDSLGVLISGPTVQLSWSGRQQYVATLYTTTGQRLVQQVGEAEQCTLVLEQLSSGIYWLVLQRGERAAYLPLLWWGQ